MWMVSRMHFQSRQPYLFCFILPWVGRRTRTDLRSNARRLSRWWWIITRPSGDQKPGPASRSTKYHFPRTKGDTKDACRVAAVASGISRRRHRKSLAPLSVWTLTDGLLGGHAEVRAVNKERPGASVLTGPKTSPMCLLTKRSRRSRQS